MAATIAGTSLPAIAASPTTPAALPLMAARMAPTDNAPGSVLGLDSDDAKVGGALTTALRKAFANRGLSGGEEIPLEEMRLTMGCDNDGVACLADGGKTLGVRRLVFGYLRGTGKGKYQLDIQILDTDSATLSAESSVELTKDQLSADNIDATATEIVNALMPVDKADSDLPPRTDTLPDTTDDTTPDDQTTDDQPKKPREGGIYFGLEKPTPRWKWVGFGTTLGLTVLAGGATIGMGVWLTMKNGGFRQELLDAAEASLTDNSSLNDVDPNLPEGINLCDYAKSRPLDENGVPLGQPGQVRNSAVVAVCNKGDDVRRVQLVTGISTAVFGVATLAFTGLLLVHKRKPTADAMLRHGVTLGLAPNGRGGLSIGGGLRF